MAAIFKMAAKCWWTTWL